MLSILTGVISESMIEKGNAHREEMRFAEERQKRHFVNEVMEYFVQSDVNHDGTVSKSEFITSLPLMVKMFKAHDLHFNSAELEMVFDMVDFDRGGTIELDEFVQWMAAFTSNSNDVPLHVMRLQATIHRKFKQQQD